MKVRKLSEHKTQYEWSHAALLALLFKDIRPHRQNNEAPHAVEVTLNERDQTASVLVIEKTPSGGQG